MRLIFSYIIPIFEVIQRNFSLIKGVIIQPEFPEYVVDEGPPVQCADVVIESIGIKEPGIMCNVTVHTVDGTAIGES